ncbi:MAG: nitrate reductase subunit beta [Thermaerobacter sp.]|nr:nitrate reductase subunit beta [Thermaerobacter sp.]
MRIKAQLAMVMNLDKCIGCHTCSVTCKHAWTNRRGVEYAWFNNVETKPGVGYPKRWEDQEHWRGGWEVRGSRLELKAGGRLAKLLTIFHNPNLPTVDDYYDPWSYDYETLAAAPPSRHQPTARPRSVLTGDAMQPAWGPNWEDDLAGATVTGPQDPDLVGVEVAFEYERTFQLYLPRICNHCLNPACVASCPSGAMYKREEDGIVLTDQQACRGWRFCVSGCPYKKPYFNWSSGKAEKCLFCYPRVEAGQPTVCAESCVGRIRYLGVVLYDADGVPDAAAAPVGELVARQRALFLDPADPRIAAQAEEAGVPPAWIAAARRSPVYRLAVRWEVALPLHPEFRTLPMVWYVPPLSPLAGDSPGTVLPDTAAMRIPLAYLANLLAAGDPSPVRRALERLVAVRRLMRRRTTGEPSEASSDLPPDELEELYRLLALAKHSERFVVPPAHKETAADLFTLRGTAGLDSEGGVGGWGAAPSPPRRP